MGGDAVSTDSLAFLSPASCVLPLILQEVLGGRGLHLPRISGQRVAQRSDCPSVLWVPGISFTTEQTPNSAPPPHRQAARLRPLGETRPGAHSLCRGLRVAWESMKGTEPHMARRPLHKQLDLERKHAKQAEARLSQHLQRLEQAYQCHLRLLAWEQRQLQKQLQRLQHGNPGRWAGRGQALRAPGAPTPDLQLRPGPLSICSPARTLGLLLSRFAFHFTLPSRPLEWVSPLFHAGSAPLSAAMSMRAP